MIHISAPIRTERRMAGATSLCVALGVLVAVLVGWVSPAVGVVGASTELSGPQLAAAKECPWSECAKVMAAVAAGTKVQKVPATLSPNLQNAESDIYPAIKGCVVDEAALSTPFPCVDNPSATAKKMVLLGDSHAEMWSPAIDAIAKANGYSLLFLSKIQCLVPLVPFWNPITATPNTQCATWKKWAITRIQQFDPSVVIVAAEDYRPYSSNALPMSQKTFSSGLVTTLKDLAAPGRRVVLLGDIPYLAQTGPICLAAHEGSVQSCSTPTTEAVNTTDQAAERSAATKAGATFINVIPWFCTQRSCPATVSNFDVYSDGTHITATYGMSLEGILTEALGLGEK